MLHLCLNGGRKPLSLPTSSVLLVMCTLVLLAPTVVLGNPPIPVGRTEIPEHGPNANEFQKHMQEPFFRAFVHNQRRGFPFPNGQECEADAHKVCGGILKTCMGSFGCSLQCLTDHIPSLSPKCQKAHPCYPDIDKHCSHIKPGHNDMMTCLLEKKSKLSHACLAHHPCLRFPHIKCRSLDYNTPPVPFVGDIGRFLTTLRSGHLFSPIHRFPRLPMMQTHHRAVRPGFRYPHGMWNQGHKTDDESEKHIREEKNELRQERSHLRQREQKLRHEEQIYASNEQLLLKERQELEAEREHLRRAQEGASHHEDMNVRQRFMEISEASPSSTLSQPLVWTSLFVLLGLCLAW